MLKFPAMAIVTLLSDYGTTDSYVAETKGVLLQGLFPPILVDITHEVPSFDIRHAAFQLWRAYSFFPKDTWHLALVEPAEKKVSRAVYVRTRDYHFVGADNGILKWAVEEAARREGVVPSIHQIHIPKRLEAGYWGRDAYADFVRRKLDGVKVETSKKGLLEGESFPEPIFQGDQVLGEVLTIDCFGNVVTNLPLEKCKNGKGRWENHSVVSTYRDYVELPEQGVGLIPGSNGLVEISARNASAAERGGLKPGTKVIWTPS